VVVCSDTHLMHEMVNVPDGDIFIHCGDFTNRGTIFEAISFNKWLGSLPHKHKIVIPGNHENFPDIIGPFLTNATHFLLDSYVELDGVKIWGSRFKPSTSVNWYMNDGQAKVKWDPIPDDLDILVTHQPPKGIFDDDGRPGGRGNAGLLKLVEKHQPKVHLFGHLHEHYGSVFENGNTTFANAAMCISKKKRWVRKKPISFDIIVHSNEESKE
jgi:Icc-related predicted phosphoesterase